MLKNWAKALDDATAALETESLPPPQRLKAARRAARAALRLGKLPLAHAACEQGREAVAAQAVAAGGAGAGGDAGGGAGGGGGGGRGDEEIEEIAGEVREAEAAEVRKREVAAAAAREAVALEAALAARGVRVGEFADDALREQVVGSSSGARVWWDAEQDTLHWPLSMLRVPLWWRHSSPPWPPRAGSPGAWLRYAPGTNRRAAQGPMEGCYVAVRLGGSCRFLGSFTAQAAACPLPRGGHE